MADPTVSVQAIPHLLKAGDLPVPPERHRMIAEQLRALFDDANALNRKMARMHDITPAIRFHHPDTPAEEE